MQGTMTSNESMWSFGTRQVVYAAIGAALYGVFSWATNFIPLPAAGNVTFRPAVAIPMFFGVAFGPLVGFFAGFVGNVLGDFISGWGFFWNWSLGNGIMGLVAGLGFIGMGSFRKQSNIIKAVIWSALGAILGMAFASFTEIIVGGIDIRTATVGYWAPAAIGNVVVGIILVPILMVAYAAVQERSGR